MPTPIYNWTLPVDGGDTNVWGAKLNNQTIIQIENSLKTIEDKAGSFPHKNIVTVDTSLPAITGVNFLTIPDALAYIAGLGTAPALNNLWLIKHNNPTMIDAHIIPQFVTIDYGGATITAKVTVNNGTFSLNVSDFSGFPGARNGRFTGTGFLSIEDDGANKGMVWAKDLFFDPSSGTGVGGNAIHLNSTGSLSRFENTVIQSVGESATSGRITRSSIATGSVIFTGGFGFSLHVDNQSGGVMYFLGFALLAGASASYFTGISGAIFNFAEAPFMDKLEFDGAAAFGLGGSGDFGNIVVKGTSRALQIGAHSVSIKSIILETFTGTGTDNSNIIEIFASTLETYTDNGNSNQTRVRNSTLGNLDITVNANTALIDLDTEPSSFNDSGTGTVIAGKFLFVSLPDSATFSFNAGDGVYAIYADPASSFSGLVAYDAGTTVALISNIGMSIISANPGTLNVFVSSDLVIENKTGSVKNIRIQKLV